MNKSTYRSLSVIKVVKKRFQSSFSQIVLNRVTLSFSQGLCYAIAGLSGAGKTTLLHLLAGLEPPDSGVICIDKKNIWQLSSVDRSRFLNQTIGLMFQSPFLIHELSIGENVMLPGLIAGKSRTDCKQWSMALLKMVGLQNRCNSRPSELSGGQQQRVTLARALFNKPSFLLADEPTGNLDDQTGKGIIQLLLTCKNQWGMGVIVSSHDQELVKKMDQIYEIKHGVAQEKTMQITGSKPKLPQEQRML
ncbi:ABC transporter ATP-binding protein [Candidatus Dependentiae bacterium]|nr:ABC transporter ATP-binding protein [Candidatus Dependentiae bacterium]